jgi:hypothetical protein
MDNLAYDQTPVKNICLHSRKIMPLMDASDYIKKSEFMQQHVAGCECCSDEISNVRKIFTQVENAMPKIPLDSNFQESFRAELDEAFNAVLFPEGSKWQMFLVGKADIGRQVGRDLKNVIFTKRVAGLCALGVAATVVLNTWN